MRGQQGYQQPGCSSGAHDPLPAGSQAQTAWQTPQRTLIPQLHGCHAPLHMHSLQAAPRGTCDAAEKAQVDMAWTDSAGPVPLRRPDSDPGAWVLLEGFISSVPQLSQALPETSCSTQTRQHVSLHAASEPCGSTCWITSGRGLQSCCRPRALIDLQVLPLGSNADCEPLLPGMCLQ